MNNSDKLISHVAKKVNKDIRVVQHIVNHPFKFIKKHVVSSEDDTGIRLAYFGVFFVKPKNKKILKYKNLCNLMKRSITEEELYLMPNFPQTKLEMDAKLDRLLEERNFEEIFLMKNVYAAYWSKHVSNKKDIQNL